MERSVRALKAIVVLGLGLAAAACSTPSQRYGLPPPAKGGDYPNINVDPAAKSPEPVMTPAQRAEAEAELKRQAGKRPKVQAPAAN